MEATENDFYAIVPEGKLKVINQCGLNYEGRNILLQQLEDKSVGIHITRLDRGDEDVPQALRLSELTLVLLLHSMVECIKKFDIDFDAISDDINKNLKETNKVNNGSKKL